MYNNTGLQLEMVLSGIPTIAEVSDLANLEVTYVLDKTYYLTTKSHNTGHSVKAMPLLTKHKVT